MNDRDNILKAIRFEQPDYIPMIFHINPACWHHFDQTVLQDLMEEHTFLFPDFLRQDTVKPGYALNQRRDEPYTDPWGCVWQTMDDGITGAVHGHPLERWDAFSEYTAPDPMRTDGTFPVDWEVVRAEVSALKKRNEIVVGSLPHGHTFLRLQDIRGYENLMYDMMDEDPRLSRLLTLVEEFNSRFVAQWMDLEPDIMSYPEDLGMQVGPLLSPENFRRYIKPVYHRLMKPAREKGCLVHMHSDGDIRTLVDDLIDGGVDIVNLQDNVNGIDWIEKRLSGKVCIDLDIDRQLVTAQGTPRQIDDLIREEVRRLASPKGGLMMIYGLYPGVPLENVRALMDAMEKYSTFYS
jgi:uroporphyrinogen decarboxylase